MALNAPQKPLGQLLKEMELVTEGQIQEALSLQREKGGALGSILVELGYVSEEEMLLALGAQVGMEVVNLDEMKLERGTLEKVSPTMAKVYKIIPVKFENNMLTVAMADPLNVSVLDDLRFMLNCDVQGAVSNEDAVTRAINQYYAGQTATVEDLLAAMGADMDATTTKDTEKGPMDLQQMADAANSAPVVKLLNLILLQAIKDQASDIHFEPFETEFKVRYRVDGVLYEMMPPPLHLALALISRIKVMSNLDISEVRLPQDGRIMLAIGGKPVDLRISTLPTMFGESVVMRVLDRSVVSLDIDNIGLREEDFKLVKLLLDLPNGIMIVTGPTGSGKTTTLYSCLNYINDIKWKTITTEDPVEYDLDGIVQCQINEEVGVTYSACLRSILRQDPDYILVGEIRDLETAQIAIEASLTGHLVFSTLHTNDAPSSITRMLDLGIETFLISATLEAVVAQRLVRRVCVKCKTEYEPTEEMLMQLGLRASDVEGKRFMYGTGCNNCNNTGYRGRQALFEIMLMTDRIRNMVMQSASTDDIRRAAREQGLRVLREAGLLAIYDGVTSIEEVVRETLNA
ncbi:MAG: Flp pilus assembly complex ATPase component TadA [Candidatus Brocadiae bacterium]|nr:Flp pilus assembly complex ATPase component TadA [Candidatus Brocadiia bacterium]